MNRKKTPLILCLCLALLLGGCHSDPVGSEPPQGESPSPAPAESAAPPFASQGMRVALCTSPGTVDDRGRNSKCYDGVLDFLIARGGIDSVVPLQETTGDPAVAPSAFRELAAAYDVMVFVGPAFSQLGALAQENPNKYFILVDAPLTGEDGAPIQLDNVCSLEFAEQECGFLAGMAAAMETQTGRVAVINGEADSSATRYYYGFRSGVAYANGNLGTSAEVIDHPGYGGTAEDGSALGGNYTGGSDVTAYALANSLMDEGCDILLVAAEASGVGAVNAVKSRPGTRIIGAETDQYLNGVNGTENVMLTSVTKEFANSVTRQLLAITDGTFQSGAVTLRAADGATGYISADGHQQLRPESLQALADAYPLIQNGTIVPMAGPQ